MLGEHSSYHNEITGEEAMYRLRKTGHSRCYLTRFSQDKHAYVLSVYWKQRHEDVQEHFELCLKDGRCKIVGKELDFESVSELLEHYETQHISPSLPNIGKNCTLQDYSKKNCVIS